MNKALVFATILTTSFTSHLPASARPYVVPPNVPADIETRYTSPSEVVSLDTRWGTTIYNRGYTDRAHGIHDYDSPIFTYRSYGGVIKFDVSKERLDPLYTALRQAGATEEYNSLRECEAAARRINNANTAKIYSPLQRYGGNGGGSPYLGYFQLNTIETCVDMDWIHIPDSHYPGLQ